MLKKRLQIIITGAFNKTSYASIRRTANQKDVESLTIHWIEAMLKTRITTASQGDAELSVTAAKCCPTTYWRAEIARVTTVKVTQMT